MISRRTTDQRSSVRRLLDVVVLALLCATTPPGARAQTPGRTPGPASSTPPPVVTPAPGVRQITATPAVPGVSSTPLAATPTPGVPSPTPPGQAPAAEPGSEPLPLDPTITGSSPLITATPPANVAPTPKPGLPPAAVTELDNQYRSAATERIPYVPHEGQPVSLLQAIRVTLSNNTQIQLSGQDAELNRAFLQQNTGAFDSHVLFNGSKERDATPRTFAELRQDYKDLQTKATLARQFLAAAARLQADLDHSRATNTLPTQDYSTGNSSSVSSMNGVLSNSTVTFLNQSQQDLANAQKQQQDAFAALLTQVATQNATPAQIAQFQALQQQNITLEQQTEQQFITAFNDVGNDLANSAKKLPNAVNVSNTASYSLGASKIFRNGISVQPTAGWTQQNIGGGSPPVDRARLGVVVNVPLLRGYGVDATGAPERAAGIDYEASQLTLHHSVALSVYQTALLYWSVVAAQRRVDVLRQSQQVATTLLNLSNQLVQADELARADVFVIAARANDTALQVYAAELALLDAQQQLAVQIGVDPAKIVVPLIPLDDFPAARSLESVRGIPRDALLRTADGHRADLAAARKLQASGRVLARAAVLNLKPRLDFSLNVSMNAVSEGGHYEQYIHTFGNDYSGPSVLGSITFDWPVANNVQRGLLSQARATLQQRNINTVDLERAVASGVVFSLATVENSLQQLQEATTARDNYRKSLDAEYAKLKAGSSTFLNAVETEELYTSSGLNLINAQLQYASGLARTRYETGTLLPASPTNPIDWEDLTTLPAPAAVATGTVRSPLLRPPAPTPTPTPARKAAGR